MPILDNSMVQNAVDLVTPAVRDMMVSGMIKNKIIEIAVCSPDYPCWLGSFQLMNPEIIFDGFISLSDSVKSYESLQSTLGIAKQCWKARCSSDELSTYQPAYNSTQMPTYNHPAAVYINGLVVVCNGAKEYQNFMIASWIGAACVALCTEKAVEELLIEQKANAPTW